MNYFLKVERITKKIFLYKYQLRTCFHNPYPRPPKEDTHSSLFHVVNGWKLLKEESRRLLCEVRERVKQDPPRYYHGEVVPQFQFKKNDDFLKFQTITDHDNGVGFSNAELAQSQQQTALFYGHIDTKVPRDGETKSTGYAILQSYHKTKSFLRRDYYNWEHWTHLVVRCRGDGRTYMITLSVFTNTSSTWHLVYQYPLFTRGGPYWQTTYIPFSKFFQVYKGVIQDKQCRIPLNSITKVAVGLMDNNTGQFNLELDYIACKMSCGDFEEFAYETYETSLNYTAK